jgi:hypothetical protein
MGFLDKIKQSFGNNKLKKEQVERLRESLRNAIADGVLTEQELVYINGFYADSALSPEDFQKLKSELFTEIVHSAIADRRVTEHESQTIFTIAHQLELSPEWVQWAREQIQYYALFHNIESGGALPVGSAPNLILQKGEVCHLSIPAQLLEERVINRQYVGGSQGVSIRLMKGVTYRIGQQRGHIQSQSGLIPISDGYFIITNKRLVFSGNKKSVVSLLDKLIDFQLYADALQFSVSNRQKPTTIRLARLEEVEISGLIVSRLLNGN